MPHEMALREAAHMRQRFKRHRVSGAINEDAHWRRFSIRVHLCPHARRSLWVESCVNDVCSIGHFDFLFVCDFDRVFVDSLHIVGVEWPFGLNKSDAPNGSKGICRVFKVSSSPLGDPKR